MGHAELETQVGAQSSEGNVMLIAGVALVVALLGFVAGRGAHDTGTAETLPAHVAAGASHGVATASPEASQAALAVLAEGGNAFDAMVTASFAVSVTRPQSTGIGGGGFVVFHVAATDQHGVYDGREVAPSSATHDMYLDEQGQPTRHSLDGIKAGGVPGLVRMLHEMYQQHSSGKLSWERLVQPAIELAEEGFVVTDQLAEAIEKRSPVLRRYADSERIFLPDGRAPRPGETLVQKDLARTLRTIARDPESFYEGELAEKILRGVPHFQPGDLAGYDVQTPAPVRGSYRGHTVISMPPPSSGGVHLIQMLNIISQHPRPLGDLRREGADHLHLLAEAMRRAYADRSEHLGDPYPGVGSRIPVGWLTSPSYAKQLYAGIDMRRATPSAQVKPGQAEFQEGDHTTHISIVDREGNAVSSTQTINTGMGSGYVIAGTGILLNNEMDDFAAKPGSDNVFGLRQGEKNSIKAGRRPLSSMTPTIVLDPRGRVRLVVGSPGGPRIITSTLQVLLNVVDFELPLDEAVSAPRIHHQWLTNGRDELFLDEGFPRQTLRDLTRRGHVLRVGAQGLGNVQAVLVEPEGRRIAVSDPRGTGRPAAN